MEGWRVGGLEGWRVGGLVCGFPHNKRRLSPFLKKLGQKPGIVSESSPVLILCKPQDVVAGPRFDPKKLSSLEPEGRRIERDKDEDR